MKSAEKSQGKRCIFTPFFLSKRESTSHTDVRSTHECPRDETVYYRGMNLLRTELEKKRESCRDLFSTMEYFWRICRAWVTGWSSCQHFYQIIIQHDLSVTYSSQAKCRMFHTFITLHITISLSFCLDYSPHFLTIIDCSFIELLYLCT